MKDVPVEVALYVDRIEGALAVLTGAGHTLHLPLVLLPSGAREGSHLRMALTLDPDAAADEQARIEGKSLKLRGGDDGGDLGL